MAPLKFEEHIKEKLDQREISPSVRAWDEISAQLETPSKKPPRKILWYGIAAGFVGLFIFSLVFLNADNSKKGTENTVSDTDQTGKQEQLVPAIIKDPKGNETLVNVENGNKEIGLTKDHMPSKDFLMSNKEEIKEMATIDSVKKEENEALWKGSEEIVEAKIAALVAQVAVMQEQNNTVTESELDSMLRNAQQEILMEKYLKESHSVDATALLLDVEDELEQSFRDQLFETLKSGFLKVRTAVADRNK